MLKGSGKSPMNSTATASSPSTSDSRGLRSVSAATWALATGPKITRLYISSVYAAPQISVVPATRASQKLVFMAPMMTMNSPTKPLVAGRPQLAMAKSIVNAANLGMLFTTPP
jgi:hypothetical protein